MADNFGLKIGLEGEKEFKKSISEINQTFKVLGSEMKLVTAQFDKNDNSIEALTARQQVLGKEVDAQRQKVETLRAALANATESFGENDRRTQQWQIQLNNAEAALIDLERQLDESTDALDKAGREMDDTGDQADDMGDEVDEAADEADDAGKSFESLGTICKATAATMAAAFAAVSAAAIAAGKRPQRQPSRLEAKEGGNSMAVTARRTVREIPRAAILNIDTTEIMKLVVVAYARVSTEKEEQEDSFERQVSHYTTLITSKPEWSFGGIYADPGITGTRAEKRPDFMRMIADCRAGKINKILVKSISRFARNTVDALNYIRELKELGISIYFENENIDTLTPGGEVLITILAAMAEQESRTMSTNIKWTYQKKFKNGEVILNTGLMLGYTKTGQKDADGRDIYEINEAEATIVRRIYREYLAGTTITRICRGLEEDGIPTKLGKKRWQYSVVNSILTNEKYTGDAVLGKTFKPDVLSKYRQKNNGQAPMYYAEGTHPAIIDKEMFEMVRVEMQRRKDEKVTAVGNSKYTSKYPFSGLLICGECGHKLRRHVRRVGSGLMVPAWGCSNRISNGRAQCDSHHVNEDTLQNTYTAAIRDMIEDAEEIMMAVKESAGLVMEPENKAALERIEQEIIDLQNAVLELHKAKQQRSVTAADYAAQIKEYSQRMQELEARQAELQTTENRYGEIKMWLDSFAEHIQSGAIMDADDSMIMKQLVEQIIVNDDGIEVHFKCGIVASHEYM